MCILFIAVDMHPQWPLIVCANRDEFHHRATEAAHFWPAPHNSQSPNPNQILAGKDLQAGGTWLGVNQSGHFAALTNIRNQQAEGLRSRGELVLKALKSDAEFTLEWLQQHSVNYSPFNLVYQQQGQLFCFNSVTAENTQLTQGFHAVSNGAVDDIWPKMAKGQQALEQHLLNTKEPDIEKMLAFMRDESQAEDSSLPSTGIGLEWERLLSSIFIQHPEYGTRSTSIVMQDNQGNTDFNEVRYDGKARNLGQQHFVISRK
ncbi:NRDE family protein [Shewanella donghaensis]|uniref:NRDE family protein n=1 Tax=Shewanella donghaensis TaxID=238836 RepID=UPI0011830971|nr:NRDE family protein [Shewanella donghaensis]